MNLSCHSATTARPATAARALAGLALAATLLSGCGGGDTAAPPSRPTPPPATDVPPVEDVAEPPPPPSPVSEAAVVARPSGAVEVFTDPADPQPELTLDATTAFGSPRALLVVGRHGEWLEVQLPVRPNGRTGFIRAEGMEQRPVEHSLEVDLADRTLTLRVGGEILLRTPVAVGSVDAPTPTGEFHVVDKLSTVDPGSPYGPFALGLSGHSDVLTEFAGGEGQIGIHGTSDPSSIGRAVSHGCIRVPNDVVSTLAELLPLGTPVSIV